MKLLKFQVENFRSVDKSEWIDTNNVTALIGTNESGKTNLLCALWKLNPAGEDGEVNLLSDAPRKLFSQFRSNNQNRVFIRAQFLLNDAQVAYVASLRKGSVSELRVCLVERSLSGRYSVGFPNEKEKTVDCAIFYNFITDKLTEIKSASLLKSESEEKRETFISEFEKVEKLFKSDFFDRAVIIQAIEHVSSLFSEGQPKTSQLTKVYEETSTFLSVQKDSVESASDQAIQASRDYIVNNLPAFVYYSNYGNLDSEIYLPHVIDNIKRDNLGAKEAAKVKTLKVLFDFVKLKPQDILDLGNSEEAEEDLTEEEIKEIARQKKERSVLLQSASTELTTRFRDWWKQGEYRFRFQADGDHFRIWVSDDKRPEDIELEGRSTGLQWFLSFYLTFLVESKDAHENSILLLDEPGLSLHPLAQKDLSLFFDNLSKTNQILYTTHSPFLVDSDHLDRVKAVYIQDDGTTNVSANLRAGEGNAAQTKSIYPVHAALGLSVSEMLFNNCQAILVEGPSDQIYLSALKTLLISFGEITPKRDIVFIPSGGARGIKPIVSLLTGKNSNLPKVLLDSDDQGIKAAESLRKDIYQGSENFVLLVSEYSGINQSEIEDLIPANIMLRAARYFLRTNDPDVDFDDFYQENKPILKQMEQFASDNSINLQKGWKVELAKQAKLSLLKLSKDKVNPNFIEAWRNLFTQFETPDH